MTGRTYAQIECSLTESKKLRGLSNHQARWAYLCVHLSDFCTYTGLFRYPLHIWSHDAQITVTELEAAIAELVHAGLIDHDAEEAFVRIIGWFHKRSGPDNPNRVDSVISDLRGLDEVQPEMLCKSAAELASATVKRSLRWSPDKGQAQLYQSLRAFLSEMFQDHGDLFLDLLEAELASASSTVSTEIRAMLPALALTPLSVNSKGSERVTPTLREHETRRDETETKTKTKKDEDEKTNGAAFFQDSASPQQPDQAAPSEGLRREAGPTGATKLSKLAQQAIEGHRK